MDFALMQFPVYIHVAGHAFHPHPVLEGIAYFTGVRVYAWTTRRNRTSIDLEKKLIVLLGCIFGAWLGSKLLAWVESPSVYLQNGITLATILSGKTIVGGLLGGWAGVELAKRACGIRQSTGDAFVLPLALGTAIGRVGCFLTGLADRTYGNATSLPWGVDFGDGVPRHPTQLYESLFVVLLLICLYSQRPHFRREGEYFRAYFIGYLSFRLVIEFLKPREFLIGPFSAIQMACIFGIIWTAISWRALRHSPVPPSNHV